MRVHVYHFLQCCYNVKLTLIGYIVSNLVAHMYQRSTEGGVAREREFDHKLATELVSIGKYFKCSFVLYDEVLDIFH